MLIRRYSKLKNGMYKIFLENSSVVLHENLILKYELLLKKEIDDDLLVILEYENLKYQAYEIALKELKKKLCSEKELGDILRKKQVSDAHISSVINLLKEQGYLDDDVYLESYIHDRILLSSDGPNLIQKKLIDKGFLQENIQEKLACFDEKLERERVSKIISKYLKQNRKSQCEFRLKMKQILGRLGYSESVISSILAEVSFDEGDIYQREYNKIYKKLSSKYQGEELLYKVRQKMYQKGFRA